MNDPYIYEVLHGAVARAETVADIEILDTFVDALAAQALGRSAILLEQFNLGEL